jgi:hypothetical protein
MALTSRPDSTYAAQLGEDWRVGNPLAVEHDVAADPEAPILLWLDGVPYALRSPTWPEGLALAKACGEVERQIAAGRPWPLAEVGAAAAILDRVARPRGWRRFVPRRRTFREGTVGDVLAAASVALSVPDDGTAKPPRRRGLADEVADDGPEIYSGAPEDLRDSLAMFVARYGSTPWAGPDGRPRSWRVFVLAMQHMRREHARNALRQANATGAGMGGGGEGAVAEWTNDRLQEAGWA